MLYCVEMSVEIPPNADPATIDRLKADEKQRSQDLQRQGKWPHLWRVAGRYANISILDVADHDELHAIVSTPAAVSLHDGQGHAVGPAPLRDSPGRRLMSGKIYSRPADALDGLLFDGMTIMSGGFGLSGNPETLIPAIKEAGVKNLTVISNNCGADGFGLWMLLDNGQIRKMISSLCGREQAVRAAVPVRQAGAGAEPPGPTGPSASAPAAPAFRPSTPRPASAQSWPKASRSRNSTASLYVRERWLRADLSIVKAWKADPEGNLVYRKTARNFNPVMATAAANMTVVEVEEIVAAGELDADCHPYAGHLS